MKKVYYYFCMCRPVNALITFIAVILGAAVASANGILTSHIWFAAISAAAASSAGNVINDIFDVEADRINRPERVLPSGRVTLNQAKIFYAVLLFVSVSSSVPVGFAAIAIVVFSNLLLFYYSLKLKKIILAGNITVALLTALAFIYGSVVAGNPAASVFPAAFAFIINFIREIIKDSEDIEGDRSEGVITFPQIKGPAAAFYTVAILTVVLIGLTLAACGLRIYKIEFFIITMCVVNPVMVYCLKIMRDAQYSRISMLLKINMIIGLGAIYIGSR